MLILTRKVNESVCIGDDIRVTVLAAPGGSVRLGFDAPRDFAIHRQEVFDRIKADVVAKNDDIDDPGRGLKTLNRA